MYEDKAVLSCNNNKFKISKGNLIYYKPDDYRKGYTSPNNLMKCYTIDFLCTLPYLEDNTLQVYDIKLPFPTIDKI